MQYTRACAQRHIEECRDAASVYNEAFFRVGFLAISSMRMRSKRFWPLLNDIYTLYTESGCDGVNAVYPDAFALDFKRGALMAWKHTQPYLMLLADENEKMQFFETLCGIKGLGPSKSAFISQMIFGGYFACIDSVHCTRYGIDRPPRNPLAYVKFCERLEDSVSAWYNWVCHVARRDGFDPYALSQAHSDFIKTGEVTL